MKKTSFLNQLKDMVNVSALEKVECHQYGVQAYGIQSGHEYNVIVAMEKIGNRYYFVDRDGGKLLASRYADAERVAHELIERKEWEAQYVAERVGDILQLGRVSVLDGLAFEFHKVIDATGIEVQHISNTYHDNGDCFRVYHRIA